MEIEKYSDCLEYLTKSKRDLNLLMGNGFSMAYDSQIFSYNVLQNFLENLSDPLLTSLFEIVETKNLEIIMRQLGLLSRMLEVFSEDDELKEKIEHADTLLKKGLIDAVKKLHPEHVFAIPEKKMQKCYEFLAPYLSETGNLFTTNYDILLYWVLMRSECSINIDGFGRERENDDEYVPGDELIYSELIWGPNSEDQNIHYVHGALHLFDNGIDIEKESYDSSQYLLQNIEERMEKMEYPVFVTGGDGNNKLSQIMHNKYLTFCYEKLSSITGSLVIFGFNFGPYDEHIIDAINSAALHGRKATNKLHSIYIGVFSAEDERHIRSIEKKFKCKVRIYDSKSVNIWG